ncbi:MAG: hypothetical protein H7125_12935 [Proteobacteria bacterium]|nr:hypothetical protein [Burkholderiales bacterium]
MKHATMLRFAAMAGALALSATQAVAATIDWATWTSRTTATISGGVNVTYAGEPSALLINLVSWTPTSTWADGALIGNAPPRAGNMLVVRGGPNTGVNTIVFSQAITNPVFAIWSLGLFGTTASFDFDATPTFVAGGPNAEFGGAAISVAGQSVFGQTGNGSVVFGGTFTSIAWTNTAEDYYFTVGINGGTQVIPVPAAAWLLGSGLMGLLAFSRRRKVAA